MTKDDEKTDNLCQIEPIVTTWLITLLYLLYLVVAILSFCFIAIDENRAMTLVGPATTSALHLILLVYGYILPPYEGYTTYPLCWQLYLSVDLLLFISIGLVVRGMGCEPSNQTRAQIEYYAIAIYANTMTCVSVALCIFKTCRLHSRRFSKHTNLSRSIQYAGHDVTKHSSASLIIRI